MKPDIDFEEQRTRIDKMIIDMEHDVEQRNHWKYQKFIWGLAATIAIITAVGAPFLTEYAKYIFHIENNRTVDTSIQREKNDTNNK